MGKAKYSEIVNNSVRIEHVQVTKEEILQIYSIIPLANFFYRGVIAGSKRRNPKEIRDDKGDSAGQFGTTIRD
jgi:nitrate reductase beta subunit